MVSITFVLLMPISSLVSGYSPDLYFRLTYILNLSPLSQFLLILTLFIPFFFFLSSSSPPPLLPSPQPPPLPPPSDTAFMFIIGGLILVKVFQNRHPDIHANAFIAFFSFAVVILFTLIGIVSGCAPTSAWPGFRSLSSARTSVP